MSSSGTQISDMTPSATLPAGSFAPFIVTNAATGLNPTSNYRFDLGADLATIKADILASVSYAALAASSGSSLVGFIASGTGAVARTAQSKLREYKTPGDFGVVDDPNASNPMSAIDQGTKLQAWLTACVADNVSPYAPDPIRVYSSTTLTYAPTVAGQVKQADLHIDAMVIYSSAATGFVVGSATAGVNYATLDMPGVLRTTIDWTGSTSDLKAGVVIYSPFVCTINRGLSRYWTKGYLFYSKTAGTSTNTINGGSMDSNRYNEVFLCDGADSYCNENTINKGNYSEFSDTAAQTGARYGTVCLKINGSSGSFNNNRWNDSCYQGINGTTSIPVWLIGVGSYNYWINPRWEAGKGPFMIADGQSVAGENVINAICNEITFKGYDAGTVNQAFIIQQIGGAFGNIYRGIGAQEDIWDSGDLRDTVYSGGGANVYRVKQGLYLKIVAGGGALREASVAGGFKTNINGLQFGNGGVCKQFDASKIKTFLIQSACPKGYEGRLFVEAFDSSGARLTGTVTDANGTEKYVKSAALDVTANFDGGYVSQADGRDNFAYITVRDEVAVIGIGYFSGTANIVVSRFTVKGYSTYNNAALEVITGGLPVIDPLWDCELARSASAKPDTAGTHGFWGAGQQALNNGAVSGGTVPSAWACTTTGPLAVAFTTSTALPTVGQVVISDTGTKAYYVMTPGTTSGSGTGPSGTTPGTNYTNGTVVFRYIGPKGAFAALAVIP